MSAAIKFPLTSMPGRHPQESAGRLINCYAEPLGKGARWGAVRRRVAGLSSFGTTAGTGFRGMIQAGGTIYAVVGTTVYSFPLSGGAGTALSGTLPGTSAVILAKNNKAPTPDVVAVVPGEGAFVIDSTSVSDYPDGDIGQPNAVCFLDGYLFFTYGNGEVFASALNDTAIDPLNFATAEAKPDSLIRPVPWNGQLFLCGPDSIEAWNGNPPNPTGFPFTRVTVIQPGLAGPFCVSGYEDGFGQALIFVGSDNAVYTLNGYTPTKISPPDLDWLIEQVADKSTLQASVYTARGHAFWALSSPTWTWVYALRSQTWHERASYLKNRWRGMLTYSASGTWLAGDTDSGNLLKIDPFAHTEAGNPLPMRIQSGPVHDFPASVPIAAISLDVTTGIGVATGSDPNQTDPSIEVSVSRDGGLNWCNSRILKLGRQAISTGRVRATRFGLSGAFGAIVRVDVSDPVDVGIMGGKLAASDDVPE